MGIDISQLGKDAQAQVMAKMAVQEVKKRSKYGNRKVVRDGIKFDSEREAARFGERYGIVTTYLYLAEELDVSLDALIYGEERA